MSMTTEYVIEDKSGATTGNTGKGQKNRNMQ